MLNFYVKVFYVIGKALTGELSCPCDMSCFECLLFVIIYLMEILLMLNIVLNDFREYCLRKYIFLIMHISVDITLAIICITYP